MDDKNLQKAFHDREELCMTQEQYLAYESRLKHIMDEEAAKREAELRLQEATEKAVKKGLEQGQKQGREDIARRLLEKDMTIEEVAELTQITKDRVYEIQLDLKNKG